MADAAWEMSDEERALVRRLTPHSWRRLLRCLGFLILLFMVTVIELYVVIVIGMWLSLPYFIIGAGGVISMLATLIAMMFVTYSQQQRLMRRLKQVRQGQNESTFIAFFTSEFVPEIAARETYRLLQKLEDDPTFPVSPHDPIWQLYSWGDAYDVNDNLDDLIQRCGCREASDEEWASTEITTVADLVRFLGRLVPQTETTNHAS